MAYSNWGAYVHRNGERRRDKEDVPPFGDPDVESVESAARIFVNLMKQNEKYKEGEAPWHEHCHHAVLGDKRLRLCGYKSSPELFWVDDTGAVRALDIWDYVQEPKARKEEFWWHEHGFLMGEYEGYKFTARALENPERVELGLVEPDGTVWQGVSGYCMGAGHDADE